MRRRTWVLVAIVAALLLAAFLWAVYPQKGPPPTTTCPTCGSRIVGVAYGFFFQPVGVTQQLKLWDGSTYVRYTTATSDWAHGG